MVLPLDSSRNQIFIALTLIAALLLPICGKTQAPVDEIVSRIDGRVSNMTHAGDFAGVVYVAKGDRILLEKGYGWADPVRKDPNTASKRFMIASVSKSFAAATILQLHDKGLVDIHAPISRYLPDYPIWAAESITCHHLMSHTSGVPDYINDFPIEFKLRQVFGWTPSKDDLIKAFQDRPLLFHPGEEFRYSNSGYVLLAKIVENVTHKDFDSYLWENILVPLKMDRSGLGDFNMIGNRAVAHKGNLSKVRVINNFKPQWIYGMGEMYATASDLDKWLRSFDQQKILSDSSTQAMFTPVKNNYAYGWHVREEAGHKQYSHGGYLPGWNSYVYYYPEDTLSIIILSNQEDCNPMVLGQEISNILFANETFLLDEFHGLQSYSGRYEVIDEIGEANELSIASEILMINENRGSLEVKTPKGNTMYFSRTKPDLWHDEEEKGIDIAFRKSQNGMVMEISKGGRQWRWQKMRGSQ